MPSPSGPLVAISRRDNNNNNTNTTQSSSTNGLPRRRAHSTSSQLNRTEPAKRRATTDSLPKTQERPLLPTLRVHEKRMLPTPYTFVFDLDETLACARDEDGNAFDKRPYLLDLLRLLHGQAENAIWTCGMRCYASKFVKSIQHTQHSVIPTFRHVLYRDNRWFDEENPKKPLSRLGRCIDNVLLVENNAASIVPGDECRVVLVEDFLGSSGDSVLPVLVELLRGLLETKGESVPSYLSRSPLIKKSPTTGFLHLKNLF
eukprot:PhM_4_TR11871/c0_g1_i1/m.69520/K15731/CTDSP; carboxy-terminal domain RNA polymerase II polypeptide A small phosphatase